MKKIFSLFALALVAMFAFADQTQLITVTVPSQTKVVYVLGGFNSWSFADADALMDEQTAQATATTKVFTKTVTIPDEIGDDYNYKFCAGPAWTYEQLNDTLGKFDFFAAADGWTVTVPNFQAYFDPAESLKSPTLYIQASANVKVMHITGTFEGWTTGTAMTFEEAESDNDIHIFSYHFENVDPTGVEFKPLAGPDWAYEPKNSANYRLSEQTPFGEGDYTMVVGDDIFKAIFDPANVGDVTVRVLSAPLYTDSIFMVGGFQDWKLPTAVPMVNNGDGTWTGVIENVANTEMKFLCKRDWEYQEAGTDGPGSEHSNRGISFKELAGNAYEANIAEWKTPLEAPTAVENVAASVKATKCIENGQLVIIREGIRYSVVGARF